jgi:N-methylhydantoinase A
MPLDVERALEAITTLAGKMGITPHEAASGVIQVANAAMNRAIRAISVERGYDPREFALVAFGGAGPLHACDLADTLRIPRVLIPFVPGVLSALGMTLADITKDYAQTVLSDEKVLDPARLDTIFRPLETQGQNDILNEGVPADQIELQRALDIRYKGQSHEITVAEPVDGDWVEAFDTAHESRYSYRQTDTSLVIVTARLTATGRTDKAEFTRLPIGDEDAADAVLGSCEIGFGPGGPVTGQLYTRDKLRAGNKLSGPALIVQFDTTTVIPPGWKAQVDPWGNLIILNVRGNV